jgi:TonB-linked SusC/RagA family outer membrane protein
MARVNYSYDDRYLLTATVRRDGSSVLAPGHQYLTYPAVALGWNVMNEQWMKQVNLIDYLKLRVSYGVAGNQGTAPYQTLGALSSNYYNFGTTTAGQSSAYTVTTLANTNLTWQHTGEFNMGVDFGILRNRLTGTVDVYNQNTSNILVSNVLPGSNGATQQTVNFGKTNDKGLELSLSSINIQNKDGFTWTTNFNISFDRNKVVSLPNGIQNDIPDGWFVGYPSTVIYDYKKLGIWQTGEAGLSAQTSPVQVPGQIRVEDVNGDGKITPADEQIIGDFQPQYTAGLTNRVTYKRFDLSVAIYARMGMLVDVPYLGADAGTGGYSFFEQGRNNQLKVNYWTPTNPGGTFPRPDGSAAAPLYSSTETYVNGSFIKVRNINLGYTFEPKLLSRIGISSLRIYVTAENPFILYSPFVKDGFGPDPEGNGYGGGPEAQGSSYLGAPGRQISVNDSDPSVRNFNLGLSVKF